MTRRGFTFETDTYVVDDHLIWGATARILGDLLDRLGPLAQARWNASSSSTAPSAAASHAS